MVDGCIRTVEGQRPGHLSNFGGWGCRDPANGRAFSPPDNPLPRFPGRWPGLGKLLGLRPEGQRLTSAKQREWKPGPFRSRPSPKFLNERASMSTIARAWKTARPPSGDGSYIRHIRSSRRGKNGGGRNILGQRIFLPPPVVLLVSGCWLLVSG